MAKLMDTKEQSMIAGIVGIIVLTAALGPGGFILGLMALAAMKLFGSDDDKGQGTDSPSNGSKEKVGNDAQKILEKVKEMDKNYEQKISEMKERMVADRQRVADSVAKSMIEEMKEHTAKLKAEMKYDGEAGHGSKSPSSTSRPQRAAVSKEETK